MSKLIKKIYIETYGCQMNFSDSEIVGSILQKAGHEIVLSEKEADIIFVNTCSIRDNAEQRVFKRLREFRSLRRKNNTIKLGVLGCMAERLKEALTEQNIAVDLVAGPDSYRSLPDMLYQVEAGIKTVNVLLSEEETYEEIDPVRLGSNGVSAFISIMRGCENFCAYCVVPYTRGKERSRNPETIVDEAKNLFEKGYREITLLGQNVNSYAWNEPQNSINFSRLIELVAQISPLLRVRFATSHPKDLSNNLLEVICKYPNICRSIHLPVQSGSNTVLERMKRKYTREWYKDRITAIKTYIPDCSISTDIIAGFCGETEEEHQDTLDLMKWVGYEYAFMFKYSEREGTFASKKYLDDILDDIKSKRLEEIIQLQQTLSKQSNQKDIGKIFEVLIEGISKRSKDQQFGRTSQNKVVVFNSSNQPIGSYVNVKITSCTPATLKGEITH